MWIVDPFTTLNCNADCWYSSFVRSSVFLLTSINHLAMQVTNNNNFYHLIYYMYNIRNIQECCSCTQHWCIMIYGLTIPSHPLTLLSCTKSLAHPSSSTHQWCMSLGRSILWPLGVIPQRDKEPVPPAPTARSDWVVDTCKETCKKYQQVFS